MSYSTLMVHLELGQSNSGLLKIAGDLAERLDATVIGITACQFLQIAYSDAYISGEIIQQGRMELEKEIATVEAEFQAAIAPRVRSSEWRSTVTFEPLADYLSRQARSADLFLTSVDIHPSVFDTSRHVNTGDLVMQVGRPVLIVPPDARTLDLGRVVVGWKDTRETRHAVADALPLLKLAGHVTVVEIAEGEDLEAARAHLQDVTAWLGRHGIAADFLALPSSGDDAGRLSDIALDQGADLVVAGAYGHSRLREWALGGVTRDLLLRAGRCALVSH